MVIPRWMLLSPLALSFLIHQRLLWSWGWCGDQATEACRSRIDLLDWGGAGFPHTASFPILILTERPLVAFIVLLALDLCLVGLAVRLLPQRVSPVLSAIVVIGWIGLSVAAVYSTPYAMGWALEARR